MAETCPTCQGWTRETTDMVCMTCGRDYLTGDVIPPPGLGWKRLVGGWMEEGRLLRARLAEVEAERDAALAAEKHQHSERWIEKRMRREVEARLAAVEALCDDAEREEAAAIATGYDGATWAEVPTDRVRAALRGEGDRPAEVTPLPTRLVFDPGPAPNFALPIIPTEEDSGEGDR